VARLEGVTVYFTDFVRSCVLPSEKTPVAVSCKLVPFGIEGLGGVIWIELRTAAVTVKGFVP
jgi:hypothetical protein